MGGMHLHLNSEDQALLKVVELAIAEKGQSTVANDTSLDGLCNTLAGSAPVADMGFRDDLLARLQSAISAGDVVSQVSEEERVWNGRSEIVEQDIAVVRPFAWRDARPVMRRTVPHAAEMRGRSVGWLRYAGAGLVAVAAMLLLFFGLTALLGPSNALVVPGPVSPVMTVQAVATVVPVAAAAVVQKMQMVFKIPWRVGRTPLWSPDGKKLAAWSGSQLSVWNMDTGALAYSNSVEVGRFGTTASWSPDGSKIATTAGDGVDLISGSNGALLRKLSAPGIRPVATPNPYDKSYMFATLPSPSLSWSPDGKYVASAYNDSYPPSGQLGGFVDVPTVTAEDNVIVSSVHIWEADSGRLASTLALSKSVILELSSRTFGYVGQPNPIMKVGWSPNGKYLATLYSNRTIVVWDIGSGTSIRTFFDISTRWDDQGIGVQDFQWLPDGRTIVQYQRDYVDLWDVETGTVRTLPDIPPSQGIPPAVYTADPALPHTPVPTYVYKDEGFSQLGAAAFSPQGEKLITMDGLFREWDVSTGKQTSKHEITSLQFDRANLLLKLSPDGKVALYGANWHELKFWDTESQRDIRVLSIPPEQYDDFIYDAAWSPEGSKIAMVRDKGIEVWGDQADFPFYASPTSTPLAKLVCGTWTMADGPPVGDLAGLEAVAAVGDSDVWAVGFDRGEANSKNGGSEIAGSLSLHWNGYEWQNVPMPRVGEANNMLLDVSGTSFDDVWAVGYYGDYVGARVGYGRAAHVAALILHWDGASWMAMPGPVAEPNRLLAVKAVAKDNVWAVGYSGGYYETIVPSPTPPPATGIRERWIPAVTLILHWDGTEWSRVDAPVGGTTISELSDLSVVNKNEVWAVGRRYSAPETDIGLQAIGVPATEPWVVRWDGVEWKEVSIPETGNLAEGISVSNGSGWIAASMATEGSNEIRMVRWDGQNWSEFAMPAPTRDPMGSPPHDGVADVLTLGIDDAWAVGFQSPKKVEASGDSLAMHWDGWQWSTVTTPNIDLGDQYGSNMLTGLAAEPSGGLWAVGTYYGNGPKDEPLIMRFDRSGCDNSEVKP